MSNRAEKYEAFLDELGPLVDGDVEALERHADFLATDDEARDLRFEAAQVTRTIEEAGADYVHPADFAERLLAVVDADGQAPEGATGDADDPGRTTSPGFAASLELPAEGDHADDEASEGAPEEESVLASGTSRRVEATVALAESEAQASSSPETSSVAEAASTTGTAQQAAKPKRKLGKLLMFPLVGALGLAAAAAAAIAIVSFGGDDAAPEPTIATSGITGTLAGIDRAADDGQSGVSIQRAGADGFVALTPGEAVPIGATVRTDERTRARLELADGSEVVLNHATELGFVGDTPRAFSLRDGELVADVAHLEGAPNLTIRTASGLVDVLGTKFVLSANEEVTSVRVTRGVVQVAGVGGEPKDVRAGEEGLVRRGQEPNVAPVTDLARAVAWSELGGDAEADPDDADTLAGIGSLRARRPGERQDRERPLALARHNVRVRIVGNVARTEIEEVFRNDGDSTLEGIYRFPLPADAQIARLALDVDGRMEEGAFVERDRAQQIWRGVIRNATPVRQRDDSEEFIWVPGPWRDPALLEWQRGGQFELRIFPIPAHGERRVVLAYTQTVQPQGTRRRYVYPLAHSSDDSTRVGTFDVDVRVAGADSVSATGYEFQARQEEGAARLSLTEESFQPKGDLVIDYELAGGERALRWWTYQGEAAQAPAENTRQTDREVLDLQRQLAGDERPYVAFALRPELPRATARRERDFVLVLDASQSMVGERFERARRLASRVVREMDRRDRFTVLACDYQCRVMPGGMSSPGARASAAADQWLEAIEPAGASDLVASLREAVTSVSAERREGRELHVMYLGDGVSTAGYRRAASLGAEVGALAAAEHVVLSTVGIGGDADTMALGAMARAGGGHYVPYVPGERISIAALSILETSYGASLESPQITLPAGLSDSAPEALPTMRAGQEIIVVARMDRAGVTGDVVLRGSVAGRPYEQRYPVELTPSTAAGNRFVPQLWAAQRIEQMQLSGRGEDRAKIIATSKAFGVMSRHTSLLVLESEAMFRAFRVDRQEANTQGWTGEEDLEGGESEAAGELGTTGTGRGGSGESTGSGYGMGGLRGRGARRRTASTRAASAPQARALDGLLGGASGGGRAAAPMMAEAEAAPSDDAARGNRELRDHWGDMPAPSRPATGSSASTATPIAPAPPPRRRPGQWMQQRRVRVGSVDGRGEPSASDLRRADDAERALRENEDSRDRHRDAVRRLMRAGRLERALEVAEAWVARDRQDAEALTANADVLARLGHRDEALRMLTGTVDLSPNSEALHRRIAAAFTRAGQLERACAHRIALYEIDESDGEAVGAAMRCERELARTEAADRILQSIRDASVRTRAEREAGSEEDATRFRGDFTVEATWSGGSDLDVSIVSPQGTRLSWMGGRTTVVGEDSRSTESERLGLRWTAPGTYLVEVHRTDPDDTRPIRGQLNIRILGERSTLPFTLADGRAEVARVRVRRETRMVPVTGTVGF